MISMCFTNNNNRGIIFGTVTACLCNKYILNYKMSQLKKKSKIHLNVLQGTVTVDSPTTQSKISANK